MPEAPLDPIGIPWFFPQDYDELLRAMDDARELPPTYDGWLAHVRKYEQEKERAGHLVVRAFVDPCEFPRWCRRQGFQADATARARWAATIARRAARRLA